MSMYALALLRAPLNRMKERQFLASYVADPSTRLETNGDGELIPQRRERYVFRPVLIRTLERYFADNQFPDLEKRMEIANVCNQALQTEKKGKGESLSSRYRRRHRQFYDVNRIFIGSLH